MRNVVVCSVSFIPIRNQPNWFYWFYAKERKGPIDLPKNEFPFPTTTRLWSVENTFFHNLNFLLQKVSSLENWSAILLESERPDKRCKKGWYKRELVSRFMHYRYRFLADDAIRVLEETRARKKLPLECFVFFEECEEFCYWCGERTNDKRELCEKK